MSTALATTTTLWTLDPTHSNIGFAVRHMMISTVRGRFADAEGTLEMDGSTGQFDLDVRIDAASLDTQVEQRDQHLRSPDFFDAERYPTISFKSRSVEGWTGVPGSEFRVVGDLTIRDVTREVVLDATLEGQGADPWGGQRIGYTATTRIDRRNFGLTWNQALEAGGVLVGTEVKISLDVQWVQRDD